MDDESPKLTDRTEESVHNSDSDGAQKDPKDDSEPPKSAKSGASSRRSVLSVGGPLALMDSEGRDPKENPFKMPSDNDIFMIRDRERQKKKQERLRQRGLKVHEKTTAAARISFRDAAAIRGPDPDEDLEETKDGALTVKEDPQFTIAVTRDRQVEKETLSEYITKKREMFLLQYSLGVKREEMRKLEEMAAEEEKKLELAEQYLEEDAAMFDEFLKENDKNSVEAIRIAEDEAKAKLAKVSDIKRINATMMQIKSEINKYEEQLKEYKMYKQFLDKLIPEEIRKEKEIARQARREEKKRLKEAKEIDRSSDSGSKTSQMKKGAAKKPSIRTSSDDQGSRLELSLDDYSSDDEELDTMYFKDPQQLLDIFTELEESNLSLIQNCQETEEALEEMKQLIESTKGKMDRETNILMEQIDKLNRAIHIEEEKSKELELKAKMFSYGEFEAEDQEKLLQVLNKKVEEVYHSCITESEAQISTLQMLTNIENRIEELFQTIEQMPQEKVEAAQKAKEKERRLKMREEKKELQRIHQEERIRKALERAKAEPKKQTGRRIMARSEPPQHKKKDDGLSEKQTREEEELAYFFT